MHCCALWSVLSLWGYGFYNLAEMGLTLQVNWVEASRICPSFNNHNCPDCLAGSLQEGPWKHASKASSRGKASRLASLNLENSLLYQVVVISFSLELRWLANCPDARMQYGAPLSTDICWSFPSKSWKWLVWPNNSGWLLFGTAKSPRIGTGRLSMTTPSRLAPLCRQRCWDTWCFNNFGWRPRTHFTWSLRLSTGWWLKHGILPFFQCLPAFALTMASRKNRPALSETNVSSRGVFRAESFCTLKSIRKQEMSDITKDNQV